ncbi:Cell wall integrity/stress response component-like protein [Heracleum sosnowskyi]|uniref:Cell wall integrity/stress response component-like protein n=1 Tax=Heracleum sosnowskyi TaxID=360622 RepID=A0AAD8NCY9_9APIA|nr:Cell wall integrity/stress response component-like protein [Heracleum sosnowskyi]
MALPLKPIFYLLALTCVLVTCFFNQVANAQLQINERHFSHGRKLLEHQQEDDADAHDIPIKKKSSSSQLKKNQTTKSTTTLSSKNQTTKPKFTLSSNNQTKTIKDGSTKNQTKLLNLTTTNSSSKNKTKLAKPITNSTLPTLKTQVKKLNSTSKPSNSTKPTSLKSKPIVFHEEPMIQKPIQSIWVDVEVADDDLISEFTDLPSRFQETLLPDLEKISSTSKVYLTKANKEITKGVKPIVGKKYAPAIASIVSCAFILIPFLLVSLVFNRFKAYFSLQKLLIFIQIYLYVYFSILSISGLATGLEPLRFFYVTSPTTYICVQVVQTLAYLLYILLLVMYMVLVFSMDTGLGLKLLSLGQTFVGFAVGLHYYVTVSHRALLHQLPKTSWKVQAVYATCFFLICLLDRAERRKKAYLEENGAEGKKC